MKWPVHTARAQFSELLDRTVKDGAQTVTFHGKPIAVVLTVEEYRRLRTRGRSLKALLASAPLEGIEIVLSRDTGRMSKRTGVKFSSSR
jgi:antitoxin Phd